MLGIRSGSVRGFAVLASLAIVTAYGAITIFAKEIHGLEVRQPWQDDPYDVPVSFDFVFLSLLVFIGGFACNSVVRRAEPLPTRRLVDLLRLCAVAVGVSGLTELAEWTAVALGRHNRQWTAATTRQVVALCVLSGATLGCGLLIYRARRDLASYAVDGQPDWLSDAILLCLRQARRLGPFRTPAEMGARCLERNVIGLVRASAHRHSSAARGSYWLYLSSLQKRFLSNTLLLCSHSSSRFSCQLVRIPGHRWLAVACRCASDIQTVRVAVCGGRSGSRRPRSIRVSRLSARSNPHSSDGRKSEHLAVWGGPCRGVITLVTQTSLRRIRR